MSKSFEPDIVLVDLSNLARRNYHGMAPLTTVLEGETIFTHTTKGTLNSLNRLHMRWPDAMFACAAEKPGRTFRHYLFEGYKASRNKPDHDPQTLTHGAYQPQLTQLITVLRALRYPVLLKKGIEADDVIGIICRKAARLKLRVMIVSNDGDFYQLLNKYVRLHQPVHDRIVTHKDLPAGLTPDLWHVVMAFMGDKDEVPGVPGFGEKAALKLVGHCKTADWKELLAAAKTVPKLVHKGQLKTMRSRHGRKSYALSIQLAHIIRDPKLTGVKTRKWWEQIQASAKTVPDVTKDARRVLHKLNIQYAPPNRASLF